MRTPSGLRADSPSWPLLQALISFWGITDNDGNAAGTTIRCGALALEPSYANHALKILSGPAAGQTRDATTHPAGTDTLTVIAAFTNVTGAPQQITAGTLFVILSKTPAIAEVAALTTMVETDQYYDRVFYDLVNGIAGTGWPVGTPQVPSNVIADVITICTARNIRNIDVHGALQLLADMEHYCFFGHCHESIADVVDLNGQDVDSSRFDNCVITGAQAGAEFATYINCMLYNMTGFRGMAENCAIYTPLAVSVGVSDFDHCTSLHGVLTVTVGTPTRLSFKEFSGGMILTAQTAGAVLVRGISGYLEVNAMNGAGATLDIYAHGTDIKINANCLAGTINIYGDARVTVIAGATVTVNNHTIQAESGVSIEGTYSLPNDVVENTAFTITPIGTRQISTIMLDLSNLVQNADIRVRYDMHGDGAPFPVTETFNWTVGMDDIVYFRAISGQRAVQVTVQSTVAQGAVKDIDYEYVLG